MGGGGITGFAAIFLLDDILKILHRDFAFAHQQQRSDDGTHHIPQKTVGGNRENQLAIALLPLGVCHMATHVVDLCVHF